ncbi:hypothetical protein OAB00_01960 [Akkermansiaceae bacterium]|nr:hypothetical protein [Akkermansiaceae bacterium]
MKSLYLPIFLFTLISCERNENITQENPNLNELGFHQIELSGKNDSVNVTIAGKDNLTLRVYEKDGELIAAIIDQRNELHPSINQPHRWEIKAKSDREVKIFTRKELHLINKLEGTNSNAILTEMYFDSDGDGIPDYKYINKKTYKVTKVEYEELNVKPVKDTVSDLRALPPVKVVEHYLEK